MGLDAGALNFLLYNALAGGARRIDASLDLTYPLQPPAPAQALGVIDALLEKAALN